MKKITFPMLICASALCALQAHADERQIDWSMVPGNHGRNDVTRDFVATPDPLNSILSNNFTAWESKQFKIDQTRTTTGRTQRHAVLGNPNEATASTVSYTTETIVTTQAAPENNQAAHQADNQGIYSEGGTSAQSQAQTQNQVQQQQNEQNARSSGATGQSMNVTSNAQEKNAQSDAKAKLAPHALFIQTSLASAMDQVRGIKGEMGVTQDLKKTDKAAVNTYKSMVRQMRNDVNVARVHEKQLTNEIRKYPELAKSDEFRSVTPALHELQMNLNNWESKASSPKYWQNQEQARADVDNLEKQLNDAMNKVKNFSSGKLNASLG